MSSEELEPVRASLIGTPLDATLVRVLLVPAMMRLLGKANWWALRWLHAIRRWLHLEPPAAASQG